MGDDDAVPAEGGIETFGDAASVESWMALVAAAPNVSLSLAPGALLGSSFRIERQLGSGAMGLVFLAHHLTLDRKVAIKIHRARSVQASDRLLREARALARVEHEHVIVVHEAGTWEDAVFVAMEYVDGWTAREWCELQPRSWREIVALYCKAGRGLQAAHERGLIHRDFKPDNVLVGRDGRVRVADFGLARVEEDLAARTDEGAASSPTRPWVTAGLVGSPAYMAPEQYRTAAVDAAADQFGFCVSLFEALAGDRPFVGDSVESVSAAICEGRSRELSASAAPAHVRAALRRGIEVDPQRRFPDMGALIEELERDPARSRRRAFAAVAVGGAIAAVAWLGSTWHAGGAVDDCDPAEKLAGIWDAERRAAIGAAMTVDEPVASADRFEAIAGALDVYAARWSAEWRQGCGRPAVRACLVSARGRLSGLLQFLEHSGSKSLVFGADAVPHLLDPVRCAARDDAGDARPPDETKSALAEQLADVTLRYVADPNVNEIAELERIAAEAEAAKEYRVASQALGLAGRRSESVQGEPLLRRSAALAVASGSRTDMAVAWSLLAATLSELGRNDEALEQLELAQRAALDIPEPAERASVANNAAIVLVGLGRHEEAIASFELAIELNAQGYGPESSSVGENRRGLGNALAAMGRFDDARVQLELARTILRSSVGDRHPIVARVEGDIAEVCMRTGDYACADRGYTEALAVFEEVDGPSSDTAIGVLGTLAMVRQHQGRNDESLALFELAYARATTRTDLPATELGRVAGNLAVGRAAELDWAGALKLALVSRDAFVSALGEGSQPLVNADTLLGTIYRELGQLDASAASLASAVELAHRLMAPTAPARINAEIELGHTSLAQGDRERAFALADNVVAILGDAAEAPSGGEAHFLIARALGPKSERGRAAARRAAAIYGELGPGFAAQTQLVTAWLDAAPR